MIIYVFAEKPKSAHVRLLIGDVKNATNENAAKSELYIPFIFTFSFWSIIFQGKPMNAWGLIEAPERV